MPLLDIYRAVRDHTRDQRNSLQANNKSLLWRLSECFARTWDLGFSRYPCELRDHDEHGDGV